MAEDIDRRQQDSILKMLRWRIHPGRADPNAALSYLNPDIYLAKINAAGTIQWVRKLT